MNHNPRNLFVGWLATAQPRLGTGGLVTLMILMSVIGPLSLDMYTPAIPSLPAYFGTTADMVNLTLITFFLVFAVGLLIFGPVSDRYGRKPVLLSGMIVYTLASALCALSGTIEMLIACRMLQALGGGAVGATSAALVKDNFVAQRRAQMLSILQIMMMLGPVLAPLIGGFILQFATWHVTFWVLAGFGAICSVGICLFSESLPAPERLTGNPLRLLKRLVVVARNRNFLLLLLVVSMINLPFMTYIAMASYVYVDYFGTTEQVYSYFFAITAAFATLGPIVYLKTARWVSARKFTHILLTACLGTGLLLLFFGASSPFAFGGIFLIFALADTAIRPYTTNILMQQQLKDSGSASSLINFSSTAFGSMGMALITLPWPNYIVGLSIIMIGSTLLAIVVWITLLRCKPTVKGLD